MGNFLKKKGRLPPTLSPKRLRMAVFGIKYVDILHHPTDYNKFSTSRATDSPHTP